MNLVTGILILVLQNHSSLVLIHIFMFFSNHHHLSKYRTSCAKFCSRNNHDELVGLAMKLRYFVRFIRKFIPESLKIVINNNHLLKELRESRFFFGDAVRGFYSNRISTSFKGCEMSKRLPTIRLLSDHNQPAEKKE